MAITRTNKRTTATPPRVSPRGEGKSSPIDLSHSDDACDSDGESAYEDDCGDNEDDDASEPAPKRKRTAVTAKEPAAGTSTAAKKGKQGATKPRREFVPSAELTPPIKRTRKDWTADEDNILLDLIDLFLKGGHKNKKHQAFAEWAAAQGRLPGRSVLRIRDRAPLVLKKAYVKKA